MKKLLFLLYGVITYVIFFGTFCYALGFVTELFVPKHISSPALVQVQWPWLLNAALLGLFAVQHSVMARPGFKRWWTRFVPEQIERSTFVLIACIILIAMFIFWQPVGGVVWHVTDPVLASVLTTISLIGAGIVLISTFVINHFDLFGLRQVWLQFTGKPYTHLKFRKRGFYKYVRHPLMFGFLILFWATPHMSAAHLLFALLTTGYILVALIFEERDLVHYHGEDYKRYQREVPKLIPFTKGRIKDRTEPVRQSQW